MARSVAQLAMMVMAPKNAGDQQEPDSSPGA
jgi:hypothetical protein